MNIFYNSNANNRYKKYNINTILREGNKSIREIQTDILKNPSFCREEYSLTSKELKGYLSAGFTIYSTSNDNILNGVLNFDINEPDLYIYGLCVPASESGKGIGTELLNTVKQIAKMNNIQNIKLTC